jgi:release factor glutamine methyltransferase
VRFQPLIALAAGADGLDAIRSLIASTPHGVSVALEHAPVQGSAVRALLQNVSTRRDAAGTDRVTLGRVP